MYCQGVLSSVPLCVCVCVCEHFMVFIITEYMSQVMPCVSTFRDKGAHVARIFIFYNVFQSCFRDLLSSVTKST